jgi:hypothetical protein
VDIDIQQIIHTLRAQRSGMIQTAVRVRVRVRVIACGVASLGWHVLTPRRVKQAQYRFIYKAIMDYIRSCKERQ